MDVNECLDNFGAKGESEKYVQIAKVGKTNDFMFENPSFLLFDQFYSPF